MNIFYLHKNPIIAPSFLYNKHVVKMILETAQMLCTAHHHYADKHNYDKYISSFAKKKMYFVFTC